MPLTFADNLNIRGKKQNVVRDSFKTIAEMKAYSATSLPNIFHTMCEEDGNIYLYNVNNTVDPVTGKWRVFLKGQAEEDLVQIDDENVSDTTTWSSAKIKRMIEAGGGSAGGDNMGALVPSNMVKMSAEYNSRSGYNELKWTEPADTAGPLNTQTIMVVDGLKIVRKLDSYPEDVNDGALIADIRGRDFGKYVSNAFIDDGIDTSLNIGKYYYHFFPYTDAGAMNKSWRNEVTVDIKKPWRRSIAISDTAPTTIIYNDYPSNDWLAMDTSAIDPSETIIDLIYGEVSAQYVAISSKNIYYNNLGENHWIKFNDVPGSGEEDFIGITTRLGAYALITATKIYSSAQGRGIFGNNLTWANTLSLPTGFKPNGCITSAESSNNQTSLIFGATALSETPDIYDVPAILYGGSTLTNAFTNGTAQSTAFPKVSSDANHQLKSINWGITQIGTSTSAAGVYVANMGAFNSAEDNVSFLDVTSTGYKYTIKLKNDPAAPIGEYNCIFLMGTGVSQLNIPAFKQYFLATTSNGQTCKLDTTANTWFIDPTLYQTASKNVVCLRVESALILRPIYMVAENNGICKLNGFFEAESKIDMNVPVPGNYTKFAFSYRTYKTSNDI